MIRRSCSPIAMTYNLWPRAYSPGSFGCVTIRVNSLHGQAILELGDRVVVEGVAEDGTIEAIRIAGASAFALGVQWHAEVDAHTNPANRALFHAFGAALRQGDRPRRRASEPV